MLNENLGNPRLRMAVRLALTGGSLAATFGVANAQTASAVAAGSEASLQEVVVTGSRISVPNQVSISPVTFVSAMDVAQTGVTRVEDLLNELPQIFASQGANISNGATGTATVDLRGLGAKRTLVLVNGLRLGPGDPRTGGSSDINMIPAEMIDSIEVLTGGASSTYGADAVGGVVNFKLNDHFEGVKIVADAGVYNHKNTNTDGVMDAITAAGFQQAPSSVNPGSQKSIAFIAGVNSEDGKGNATFYATYRNVAAITQGQYSYSACTLNSAYTTSNSGKFSCGGSSTAFPGRFATIGPGAPASNNTIGPNGSLTPFNNPYNFGPINFFQRPDERYTAGAFLHYDFNEHASVYANTMFMDDKSLAQIAASGAFFAAFPVNCANPFLSTQEVGTWCGGSTAGETTNLFIGRRNVEGGGRVDDLEHTDWRVVLGIKGKIVDGWDYDASWQHSIVNLNETQQNYFSTAKIDNALNVITGPALLPGGGPNPSAGQPECIAKYNGTAPSCVPYNIFSLGQVTPAALGYLQVPGIQTGQITNTVIDINFTGDLGKYGVQLPTASSGLKINFGGEWRDITEETNPDEEFQTGDLAGSGGDIPPTSGGIISREAFIEARMPLIDDHFLARSLAFETGYRYSDYNLGFKTNTFKFGVEYSPFQDIRLRGSFQRAVRAPNVTELFTPAVVGLDGNADPCASSAGKPATATQAQCVAAGVPAGAYPVLGNSANQYNGLIGGNTGLKPETALTSSFGIGWTPSFVPNLRVQIDYFDIKIENVITTIGADTILKECTQAGLLCDNIHRDGNNSLWLSNNGFVVDQLENIGQLQTRGIDLDVSYGFDVGPAGKIRTNLVGTYIDLYEVSPIASDPTTKFNCAGLYGDTCSSGAATANPIFRWRHTLRTTWSTPWEGLDITASWRYFSAMKLDSLSPQANLALPGKTVANGGISSSDAAIKAFNYLDLSAAVKLADKITFRVGVNNVFDKDPPVIGGTNIPGVAGNGNTFPQVYDALGRFIFGQITAQF